MTDPHPVEEDPEQHIGEPVEDPWDKDEQEVTSDGVGTDDRTQDLAR